jgi:hypothetical protein
MKTPNAFPCPRKSAILASSYLSTSTFALLFQSLQSDIRRFCSGVVRNWRLNSIMNTADGCFCRSRRRDRQETVKFWKIGVTGTPHITWHHTCTTVTGEDELVKNRVNKRPPRIQVPATAPYAFS